VQILDVYGNVVTNDNTDQVTLTIGNNPGGGTLSGTNPVTAGSGVATFSNLSINQPGNGYTLVASSGSLTPATSNSFHIVSTQTVEGFEQGGTYFVVGSSVASASISSTAAHDGSFGLRDFNGSDWIYNNDSAHTVQQGSTISAWIKFANVTDGRAYFG